MALIYSGHFSVTFDWLDPSGIGEVFDLIFSDFPSSVLMASVRMMRQWVDICWDGVRCELKEMAFLLFVLVKRWAKSYWWTSRRLKLRETKDGSDEERLCERTTDEMEAWSPMKRCTLLYTRKEGVIIDQDLGLTTEKCDDSYKSSVGDPIS